MKLFDERIQNHLLNGGKIKRRIRPNAIVCIDPFDDMRIFAEKKCGNTEEYTFTKQDLIADDWEIIEPEYDWNKIIKDKIFCQFWDELEETDEPCFGYLTKKKQQMDFIETGGIAFGSFANHSIRQIITLLKI